MLVVMVMVAFHSNSWKKGIGTHRFYKLSHEVWPKRLCVLLCMFLQTQSAFCCCVFRVGLDYTAVMRCKSALFCVNCQSVYLCTRFKLFFGFLPTRWVYRQWQLTMVFPLVRFINPFSFIFRPMSGNNFYFALSIKPTSIFFSGELSCLEHMNMCACERTIWIYYKHNFIAPDSSFQNG